jgi:CubicO group peptidase (beta-lactamase class C family)
VAGAIGAVAGLLVGLVPTTVARAADRAATVAARPPAAAATPATSRFLPLPPRRIVDTRSGLGAPAGRLLPSHPIDVVVAGAGGVPTSGAVAVAANLTIVASSDPGYLTAWPTGTASPTVSNVNTTAAGQTVANLAVVTLSADGRLSLLDSSPADVLVDVVGYFSAEPGPVRAGRLTTLAPTRILDTRTALGAPGPRPAGSDVAVPIAGAGGVPLTGASAVVLSLTATETGGPGFVSVRPSGDPLTSTSNLNIPGADATVANLVTVPLGPDGRVVVHTLAPTQVVADVVGWFTDASAPSSSAGLYVALDPARALDTRSGAGPLERGYRRDLTFDLPTPAAAVVVNLTITGTDRPLYLTAYPALTPRPGTSNVNADAAGATRAALAVVPLGLGNRMSTSAIGTTHLAVDLAGWFTGSPRPADPTVEDMPPTPAGSPALPTFDGVIANWVVANSLAGAQVVVAQDGRIVYARAYGQADVYSGAPVRVDSRFRIASLSKPLAAVAVMQLVEQGRLSLDQPVFPFLRPILALPVGPDPRTATITVRELLNHSSGFDGALDPFFNDDTKVIAQFGPTGPPSCVATAAWFLTFPLHDDPGTKRNYTNMNYCLIGLLIQAVTGQSYERYIDDHVLAPRGVSDMRVAGTRDLQPLDVNHVTPPAAAIGGGYFMEALGAAGNWLGTATDMVRFLDGLDPAHPGPMLVSPATAALMKARPSYDPETVYWGLGLEMFDNGAAYGHTGSLANSRTMMMHRSDGITWAIMVNGRIKDHPTELRNVMEAALATVTSWPVTDLSPDLP